MRRNFRIALAVALALVVSTAGAFAAVVSASFNKINITVNGVSVAVSGESFVRTTGDVPYSILYKGTTYLPLAKVCEFVGKNVSWDGETRTVSISTPQSKPQAPAASTAAAGPHTDANPDCTFDSLTIKVNGQVFAQPGAQFDRGGSLVPYSLLYRGTTYLPLAAVCQIVGKDISWDGSTYTAAVSDRAELPAYGATEVPDFGALSGLELAPESKDEGDMVFNYYSYTGTGREANARGDMQKYVSALFDRGFVYETETAAKLFEGEDTTLYCYRQEVTNRLVVVSLTQYREICVFTVNYTK